MGDGHVEEGLHRTLLGARVQSVQARKVRRRSLQQVLRGRHRRNLYFLKANTGTTEVVAAGHSSF